MSHGRHNYRFAKEIGRESNIEHVDLIDDPQCALPPYSVRSHEMDSTAGLLCGRNGGQSSAFNQ
jgi:hypothetical protein